MRYTGHSLELFIFLPLLLLLFQPQPIATGLLVMHAPSHHGSCTVCSGFGSINRTNKNSGKPTTTPCKRCKQSGLLPAATKLPPPANPLSTQCLIVGCGIAGPALALALSHRGVQSVILDRDGTENIRSQGYGLTLQQSVTTLRALGFVYDNCDSSNYDRSNWIYSSRHQVHAADGAVLGAWGHSVVRERGEIKQVKGKGAKGDSDFCKSGDASKHNVHVSRNNLRKVLSSTVEDRIVWGARVVSMTKLGDAEKASVAVAVKDGDCDFGRPVMAVSTSDGATYFTNLVIGCDGIHSPTRMFLKPSPLQFLGVFVMLGITPVAPPADDNESKDADENLLDYRSVFQTSDGTTRFYSMPFDTEHYMWQLSFPITESDGKKLHDDGQGAMLAHARSLCGSWHSPVSDILATTPPSAITGYNVYDRAVIDDLRATDGRHMPVTCIGDAAHPMSPFKGQGANQAIVDSLDLGRAIGKYWNDTGASGDCDGLHLETVLAGFEKSMYKRAGVKVVKSREACKFLHASEVLLEGNFTRGGMVELKKQKTEHGKDSEGDRL